MTKEQIIQELDKYDLDFKLETSEVIQAIWFYDFGKVAEGLFKLFTIHNISKSVATEYAEFCVRCDREKLPLICLEDYIKKQIMKTEMKKLDKINQSIEKHEKELERLKLLLHNFSGSTIDVCPNCKTKNYHWSTDDKWCCAFC